MDWWFCGVHLEQWTMLYQVVRVALHRYKIDDMHLVSLLGSWVSVVLTGCQKDVPVKTTPPPEPQMLTLKWVSLGRRERFCTCPCYLLPEIKQVVCSLGGALCQTSLDSLMYIFPPLLLFSGFFTVTNFSHAYNLLSLLSPSSTMANLGWWWEDQIRGMYVWQGKQEINSFHKKATVNYLVHTPPLTFSYIHPIHIITFYQNGYYNHTKELIYPGQLSILGHTDLPHCESVWNFKFIAFLGIAEQYFKHTIMCLTNFL